MWRFILISFAFLGWAFYVLSGGADYEPRANSIQARAKIDHVKPAARPGSTRVSVVATVQPAPTDDNGARPTINISKIAENVAVDAPRIEIAATESDVLDLPTTVADPFAAGTAIDFGIGAATIDLRQVMGRNVNMRVGPGTSYDRIGKLEQGATVAILQEPGNGWVELRVLETGQTGWMMAWQVSNATY